MVMVLRDKLARQGIEIRGWREGNHKTVCPKCSATRRKKRDPCLSVTIDGDGAVWNCHHCGWSGCERNRDDDGFDRRGRGMGRRPGHQPSDLGGSRRRLRYGLDAT